MSSITKPSRIPSKPNARYGEFFKKRPATQCHNHIEDKKCISILYTNARSIRNKRTEINTILQSNTYQLIFISETWLNETDLSPTIFNMDNHGIIRNDRDTHAGGVAVLYSTELANKIVVHSFNQNDIIGFELLSFDIYLTSHKVITFVCVYLPPQNSSDINVVLRLIKVLRRFASKREVYFVGDFNFGDYKWDHSLPTQKIALKKFLLFLEEYSLNQIITGPTHDSGNTLDLVITSTPENVLSTELLGPLTDSCDHTMIQMLINSEITSNTLQPKKFNFYKADYEKINRYLSNINWVDIFSYTSNIDEMYSNFMQVIQTSIQLYTPISTTYKKTKLPKHIRTLLKEKQRLYKISKHDNLAKTAYQNISKEYTSAVKAYKNKCEQNVINNKNKKVLYNFMKKKLRTNHQLPPLLQPNNEITLDAQTKANLLNSTFAKIFLKDELSTDTATLHTTTSHIIPHTFQPISHQDILESITKLKKSVSKTPDSIPSLFIKKTSSQLVQPLYYLLNYSMQTSEIPSLWKIAIVVPIYKKGKRNDPSNYRPISLTSVLCRLLEKIIHKHILKHMMNNNLISTAQHGFITGRSTQTQQIHFLNKLTQSYDDKQQTEIVYLDFSKAFDTVSHKKLLNVLDHYKLDPRVTNWIENYLSQRQQTTVVDNVYSNFEPVTSGVPQGSVLAPLLFIIYTEDLLRAIHHVTNKSQYLHMLMISN